eukprot:TRINITY_DN6267_c0_g1_i1.p1 TRINITY_DN6267_c0_g1~~TRINITY_DN6267_c0_g1_i1.p1  ORF type:complete len:679 (-),score=208.15 TRINITY_DN6267_c0_g1_i1:58-2094(-)
MDNYELLKVVGKGSHGEVFMVRHRSEKQIYVLKKIALKDATAAHRNACFQEVKLLSTLHHPNIVEYKESFMLDSEEILCIVMTYCSEGDVHTRLEKYRKEKKLVPPQQVIEWLVQIALALQYLHKKKIIHRDLKTQNLFLMKNNTIRLGDFGIARILEDEGDMAKTMVGTPYFMSPELFEGKPYNQKTDMWSLGCCLFEMTSLKHAFDAREMNGLIQKVLRGTVPSVPSLYNNTGIPELIRSLLQKQARLRPSANNVLKLPFIVKFIQSRPDENQPPTSSTNSAASSNSTTSNSASSSIEQGNTEQKEIKREEQNVATKKSNQPVVIVPPPPSSSSADPSNSSKRRNSTSNTTSRSSSDPRKAMTPNRALQNQKIQSNPIKSKQRPAPSEYHREPTSLQSPRANNNPVEPPLSSPSHHTTKKSNQQPPTPTRAKETAAPQPPKKTSIRSQQHPEKSSKIRQEPISAPQQQRQQQESRESQPLQRQQESQQQPRGYQFESRVEDENVFAPQRVLDRTSGIGAVATEDSVSKNSQETSEFPINFVSDEERANFENLLESGLRLERRERLDLNEMYKSQVGGNDSDSEEENEDEEEDEEGPWNPSSSGSLVGRSQILRDRCVQQLGRETFNEIYNLLKDPESSNLPEEAVDQKIVEYLGREKAEEFGSLVKQLLFLEESML